MDGASTPVPMSPGLLKVVVPASPCRCGGRTHESYRRKSRMVEISSSGSGEGPGWATGPGYSTMILIF